MKKVSILLVIALIISLLVPFNVSATAQTDTQRFVFSDGSYIILEISETGSRASNTKSGDKVYTYYSASDVRQWKATVIGTFTYDGTTATCTAVSTNFTVYASGWALDSVSKYKSGNKAIGDFYISCSVWETSVRVQLTCDKNGNLS